MIHQNIPKNLKVIHGPPELTITRQRRVRVKELQEFRRKENARVAAEFHAKLLEIAKERKGNWGGRREGSGRKKLIGTKLEIVRLDSDVATALDLLPKARKKEYIREAMKLMYDILPPDKFKEKRERAGVDANGEL